MTPYNRVVILCHNVCKIFFSSVKPLLVDELPDVWIWGPSLADIYSARSVNHWRLHHSDQLLFARDWNWLWKLYLPSYIQFFLWKLCHGVVPSRSLLQHGGIISSDICRVCNFQPESIFHSLFSCKYAAATWEDGHRITMYLKLFPSYNDPGQLFNASEVYRIKTIFTSWLFPPNHFFGPYELLNFTLIGPYANGKFLNL